MIGKFNNLIKMKNNLIIGLMIISFILINLVFVSAQSFSSASSGSYRDVSSQVYNPTIGTLYSSQDIGTYWPVLSYTDAQQCVGRQDFIVQIAPAGCEPAVVRSDILEEQNVPVFCKLQAVKLNPLIDVKSIDRIVPSITGSYPPEISGVGYYPARAALRSYDNLLGSPVLNDVGYLVVVLKRNEVEKEMKDYVSADFTAVLKYDVSNAWGVGRSEYYLPQLSEGEWGRDYQEYSFWKGKGFLRLESLDGDRATVSVYRDAETKIATRTIEKGRTSDEVYLPGFYCQASLQLRLDDLVSSEQSVVLEVNDDKLELRKNTRFYNDKCYVSSINVLGGGAGSVEVVCDSERKVLFLDYADVELKIDDALSDKYSVGSFLKKTTVKEVSQNIYLAYVGSLPSKNSTGKEQFVILAKTADEQIAFDKNKDSIRTTLENKVKDFESRTTKNTPTDFVSEIENLRMTGYTFSVLVKSLKDDIYGVKFEGGSFSDREYKGLGGENLDYQEAGKKIDSYFDKSVSSYRDVANNFPNEKVVKENNAQEFLGERALYQAATLAESLEKKQTARDLWNELIIKYPDSARKSVAQEKLQKSASLKTEGSYFNFKNGAYVRIASFKSVSRADASVDIRYSKVGDINEEKKNLIEGDYIVKDETETKNSRNIVSVKKLKEGAITIEYDCYEKTLNSKNEIEYVNRRNTEDIAEKGSLRVCDNMIYVDKVNLKQQAKVVVIPNIKNTESQVNFTFKVGIEKRAIKLSNEKTKEMISNLNDTIKRWEDINKKLGEGVKALKGACFVTSAFLQAKTLLEGFGGKSMARSMVMRGDGGWMEICEVALKTGQLKVGDSTAKTVSYNSVDDCLHQNSADIEKSVSFVEKTIQAENERIQAIEKQYSKPDDFGLGATVNTEKSRNDYFKLVQEIKSSLPTDLKDASGKDVNFQALLTQVEGNEDLQNSLNYDDMKEIRINTGIYNDASAPAEVRAMAGKKLLSVFGKVESNIKAIDPQGASSALGVPLANYNDRTPARYYTGKKVSDLQVKPSVVEANTPVQAFTFNNNNYVAVLNSISDGRYNVKEFYELQGTNLVKVDEGMKDANGKPTNLLKTLNSQVNNFQKLDAGSYKNPFKIRPEVKYWETQPYKGMPAFVPVDINDGWYAATKQTLPSFGNVKSFEDSGRVTSFWLCNVGLNGMAQFDQGMGDDICEQINLNTGQPTNLFPGLSSSQASALITKAQKAIMSAAEQYASGVKRVNILGESFDIGVPATGKLGTQCQDFMSPDDCYLLFNVCDPVICPTSRCNLGGNYYVQDVVQSGIIGSVALCLPNIKEGIFIPVCLTGIHAGIEGYLSILKAHRDCLAESLKTGKHIGICDEIYSIYLCEFFWRQLAPVLNIIIPKMIELAYGQGTRGGGEYLTVQNAWNNMEKSAQYFSSYYAANSMKAFQIRSTEEVGTTICKAFVSTRYPNLKLLLEPDSPTQFSAWFSEIPYTDATVPATSQYKVFYHIYAGEDSGTYYAVYLKNPPGTSFYESNPVVSVASGYIPAGEYADETKDFTAPVGYRELCVRLNDQEKCGFKQVSSDFAVNYIKDKYIAEQGANSVTSEKECVSGTPSLYTLAQPNIQAGLEETGMPSLYNRGITRICSTDDPGKTTQPGRWKDVGYCDDTKVRCWIDTQDVSDNIVAKDLRNETLTSIDNMNVKNQVDTANADTAELSKSNYEILSADVNKLNQDYSYKILSSSTKQQIQDMDVEVERIADEIGLKYDRAIFNEQKVLFVLLKAELYDKATHILHSKFIDKLVPPVVAPKPADTSSTVTTTASTTTPTTTAITPSTETTAPPATSPTEIVTPEATSTGKVWESTEFIVSSDGKILGDGKETGVYISGTHVKIVTSRLGVNWLAKDILLGHVIGGQIRLSDLDPKYVGVINALDKKYIVNGKIQASTGTTPATSSTGTAVTIKVVETSYVKDVVDTSKSKCGVSVIDSLNPDISGVVEITILRKDTELILPSEDCVKDSSKVEVVTNPLVGKTFKNLFNLCSDNPEDSSCPFSTFEIRGYLRGSSINTPLYEWQDSGSGPDNGLKLINSDDPQATSGYLHLKVKDDWAFGDISFVVQTGTTSVLNTNSGYFKSLDSWGKSGFSASSGKDAWIKLGAGGELIIDIDRDMGSENSFYFNKGKGSNGAVWKWDKIDADVDVTWYIEPQY
ncbi:MAG: tetratricopeptide repeat protein [Nanoarchaeota archaeon]